MNESRSNEKIKVLIADDHAVVRQGLRQILSRNADLEVAVEAGDGREMMDHLRKTRVDVVLMDLEMPGKNGWDILVDLKHHYPKLPVIILSVHPEDQYGVRCLKRGAGGYLAKTSAPEQLVDAVRKVARGGKFVTPELAEKLLTDWDQKTGPPHENLSDREFQVFRMLVQGKGIKEIAENLSVSPTTVSTHRARILEKMGMKSNAELIQYALHHGLLRSRG